MMEDARRILAETADEMIIEAVDARLARDEARWQVDPYIDGVVGLVDAATNTVLLIVYVDDRDFEVGDELLATTSQENNPS